MRIELNEFRPADFFGLPLGNHGRPKVSFAVSQLGRHRVTVDCATLNKQQWLTLIDYFDDNGVDCDQALDVLNLVAPEPWRAGGAGQGHRLADGQRRHVVSIRMHWPATSATGAVRS